MAQPILVVYLYGGCYQDENEFKKALIATYEPDVAQRYIRRRKALDVLHDRRQEAMDLFDNKYRTDNPCPTYDRSQIRDRVRWAAGLRQEQITPEMRQEREEIDAHNAAIIEASTVLSDAWEEKFQAARLAFLKAMKVPEKKHDYFLGYHSRTERAKEWRYKIEKLKVI